MNQSELKAFWLFVERRQRAWYRKEVLKKPPPWSKDPLLQKAHYTNMYRDLDPGTQYAFTIADGFLCGDGTLSVEDAAFWLLFYRYTGSAWRTWEEVGLLRHTRTPPSEFDPEVLGAALEGASLSFGNAYLVYPMTNEQTGKSKVELVLAAFREIADIWDAHWPSIQKAKTPEIAYKMIRWSRKGIGPFSAYQAWVDYSMLEFIPFSRDEFVVAGPGAIRGASIIWGEALSQRKAEGACTHLWMEQEKHLRFDKPHWQEVGHPLYLSDVQNALCEYSKYARVRDTGRITRRYAPHHLRTG